jgi:hypothetical protein
MLERLVEFDNPNFYGGHKTHKRHGIDQNYLSSVKSDILLIHYNKK